MAAIRLLEMGSKVRTSKMPPQLTRSLCLTSTRILVGSSVDVPNCRGQLGKIEIFTKIIITLSRYKLCL